MLIIWNEQVVVAFESVVFSLLTTLPNLQEVFEESMSKPFTKCKKCEDGVSVKEMI
tara:strand:+ start:17145 stop:17312 length:168 start_codon:yes stop_codon:yes gene_type:complete